jgi:hypothetical protein
MFTVMYERWALEPPGRSREVLTNGRSERHYKEIEDGIDNKLFLVGYRECALAIARIVAKLL